MYLSTYRLSTCNLFFTLIELTLVSKMLGKRFKICIESALKNVDIYDIRRVKSGNSVPVTASNVKVFGYSENRDLSTKICVLIGA